VTDQGHGAFAALQPHGQVGTDNLEWNLRIMIEDWSEGLGAKLQPDIGDIATIQPTKGGPLDRVNPLVKPATESGRRSPAST
jgi:hypothetical protein